MKWKALDREDCPLARTLAAVGDRWTLLILRESFLRVRRFEDFQSRLEIARRVLTERLMGLTADGILERVPYQDRPMRYEYRLTQKGLDLYPVILTLVHWGDTHCFGPESPPIQRRHNACGHVFKPVLTCSECGETVDPRHVTVEQRAELTLATRHTD